MKGKKKTYSIAQIASALFLIASLLWLTISLPFVFESQQHAAKQAKQTSAQTPLGGTEEESNPFGSTTEEKAPSSNSLSEEYLHDIHTLDQFLPSFHNIISAKMQTLISPFTAKSRSPAQLHK